LFLINCIKRKLRDSAVKKNVKIQLSTTEKLIQPTKFNIRAIAEALEFSGHFEFAFLASILNFFFVFVLQEYENF
jgi:hypothetical protein